LILGVIKFDALIQVFPEQLLNSGRMGSRQHLCPEELRANRVGLRLLKIFSLVVTADRHGKTESDNQSEQRERGTLNNDQIGTSVIVRLQLLAKQETNPYGEPQPKQGQHQDQDGRLHSDTPALWSPEFSSYLRLSMPFTISLVITHKRSGLHLEL